jgi:hypothetical protein
MGALAAVPFGAAAFFLAGADHDPVRILHWIWKLPVTSLHSLRDRGHSPVQLCDVVR